MEKFIYYEITGFLPSSFVSMKLGIVTRYASKEKAIKELEKVLKEWKESDSFSAYGELFYENIYDDKLINGYRHQFVFKQKRTGMLNETMYKVVKHQISYND